MFSQFKSFEALQTVKSSLLSLCMISKSIFKDSKVSHLAETKGLPIAFAQVLRISQLYVVQLESTRWGCDFPNLQLAMYLALAVFNHVKCADY